MSSPARRLRSAIGWVLLAPVCLLAFLTVVIPLVLGAHSYTVLTGSMRPALEPGHLIAVRPTPIDDIRVGDIVTFQLRSGEPEVATHRVIGVGTDGSGERVLVTQGDANDVPDASPVREVQLRGVLVYAIPLLGYINVWATPGVKSAVVTVIGVLAIAWGVVMLLRDARRRRAAHAGVAVLAAVLLTAFPLAAPGAHAAAHDGRLLLSADGVTWTTGPSLTLIDSARRMVPGDSIRPILWVRNASADPARFTVRTQWRPARPGTPADETLAVALPAPAPGSEVALPAGEETTVTIEVDYPTTAGNATRTGVAELVVTVTLTQDAANPPLPETGGGVPTGILLAAAGMLAAGGVLATHRRSATRR